MFEVPVAFDLDLPLLTLHSLAAEQRITPWQEDASVSKCPLCACVVSADTLMSSLMNLLQGCFSPINDKKTSLPTMWSDHLLSPS